jgi:DNA-binding FadR family transcriptional regulator
MPIRSIEPQRLYRQISDQLRRLILAGEFPPGSRLPPERDLASQLGVSRPSLREALIALEVEGYVEVRMGSGIYVCPLPESNPADFDLSSEEGPLELIQARMMFEREVAAAAARNGRKAQFDAIEETIDMMAAEADAGVVPIDADRLFHLRVAEATGNSVLVGMVARLFDLRLGPLFGRLHAHFETPEVWAQAIAEHREILKALRAKNPEQARAMMQRHMEIAYRRLTSSLTRARKRGDTHKRAVKTATKTTASALPAKARNPKSK